MIGPLGSRARAHPWWTSTRLLLAVAVATFGFCMVQKAPCAVGGTDASWWHPARAYARLCASDLPTAYTSTGLAEGAFPLSSVDGRYVPPAESAPTAVLSYAAAAVARTLHGRPDVSQRSDRSVSDLAASPQVRTEAVTYVAVAAAVQLLALLLTLAVLSRVVLSSGGSPYRRLVPLASAPLLVLGALIGWDLVPVALVAAALWSWDRGREHWAGGLAGVGIAMSVWPVVLVVVVVATYRRTARESAAWRLAGAALVAWVAVNLPAFVWSGGASTELVSSYLRKTSGEGSVWRVLELAGAPLAPGAVSAVVVAGWAVLAAAAAAYAASYRDPQRLAAIMFALLVGLLVLGKSYEPGHALWLLPLAVLARPDRRDLLVWQVAEIAAIIATWWHLGGYTRGLENHDVVYPVGIAVRIVAELWLAYRILGRLPVDRGEPVGTDSLQPA